MKDYVIFVIVLRTNTILSLNVYLYNSLIRKYIDQVYWHRPNIYKFINLITPDNNRTIDNLAICVHKAFKLRNNEFYVENNQ